jgi:acyl-CoA-binding protein
MSPDREIRLGLLRSGVQLNDLKSRFEATVLKSKTLSKRPDNGTLLRLYALYKQATEGDIVGKRPGFGDLVGRAKYDAWIEVKGEPKDEAMAQYVALVDSLTDA